MIKDLEVQVDFWGNKTVPHELIMEKRLKVKISSACVVEWCENNQNKVHNETNN